MFQLNTRKGQSQKAGEPVITAAIQSRIAILTDARTGSKVALANNSNEVRVSLLSELLPHVVARAVPLRGGFLRLHALGEQAGLSQQQLADRICLSQRAYAYWERHPVALRPDQLLSLAQALNESVEDLVGTNGAKKRGAGPVQPAR